MKQFLKYKIRPLLSLEITRIDYMKHKEFLFLLILLPWLFLTPLVFAHVPIGSGDNERLTTATVIPDPAKSWAIYGELHEGDEAQYYRFDIVEKQRIYISLFTSTNPKESGFVPSFALMGPGLSNQGNLPNFVEAPENIGVMIIEGQQPAQAYYEGFSPSSQYFVARVDIDAPASGTYYIVVYEPSQGGHYGLAVGYQESFTLIEWIRVPIDQITIYQWGGQSLVLILAPLAITVAIGFVVMIWWITNRESPKNLFVLFGALAGFFFLGSGASMLFQMIFNVMRTSFTPEIAITIIFAVLPAMLGIFALRTSLTKEDRAYIKKKLVMLVIGVLALFLWAGLLIGPALAISSSLLAFIQDKIS